MRSLQTWISILGALIFSAVAFAAPQAGKDYLEIKPPQPTDTGNKVEVVEIFSYMCSHCNDFEPKVAAWVKQLPPDTQFRRMPVVFGRASWETMARSYYALEALGEIEKIHRYSHRLRSEDSGVNASDVISFTWYYAKLQVRVMLGLHHTSHSLGIKYRWHNWLHWQRNKRL